MLAGLRFGVGCLYSVGISLMFTGLNSCSVRNKVFADLNFRSGKGNAFCRLECWSS